MSNIRTIGLDDMDATNVTLSTLIEKFKKFPVPAMNSTLSVCSTLETVQPPATGQIHPIPATQLSLKANLDVATKQYQGLCLDCARAGGKFDGKCRVQHE